MADLTRERIENLRDSIRTALADISNGAARVWSAYDELGLIVESLPVPEVPEPIKDTRVYINSASRYGVTHTVTVNDGKLRCTCESATYRPDLGPCRHAVEALDLGYVDGRAEWDGGLYGLPNTSELYDLLATL